MKRWSYYTNVHDVDGPVRLLVVYLVVVLLFGTTFAAAVPTVVAGGKVPDDQPSPVEQWNQTYGGPGNDEITAIARTEGGYLLAGHSRSPGTFEADPWLVKINENGTEQWNRTYATDDNELVHAMIRTPDNGAVIVGSAGDFGAPTDGWVLKVDGNGTELWNRTYGGFGSDIFHAVRHTSDGDYLLAGEVGQSTGNSSDAWLVMIGNDGEELWSRTYGGDRYDAANSVVRTEEGYAFAGYTRPANERQTYRWLVAVNESGREQWNQTYEPDSNPALRLFIPLSLVRTVDGFILGGTEVTTEPRFDLNTWVMRVDEDGTLQWSRTYDVVGDDFLHSMTIVPNGGVVIAGEGVDLSRPVAEQHSNAWVMKLTCDGQIDWTRTFGKEGRDGFLTIHSVRGGYLLGGYTTSFGVGDTAGIIVRIDSDEEARLTRTTVV